MENVKIEDGVVVGTSGDKFLTKNPIALYLLRQFDKKLVGLLSMTPAQFILEVGCGEGHVTKLLLENTTAEILATDISYSIISQTKNRLVNGRLRFDVCKLEDIRPARRPDLAVCCEVLEHLPDPLVGLRSLLLIDADRYLLSVPREPIFRMMNVARGAYVRDLGNSPGHLHHWSKRSFIKLVSSYLEPIRIETPLPWTMILCRKKK